MKQSSTNEHQIMNYLLSLRNEPATREQPGNTTPALTGKVTWQNSGSQPDTPDRNVINNILGYAKALDTLQAKNGDTYFVLSN